MQGAVHLARDERRQIAAARGPAARLHELSQHLLRVVLLAEEPAIDGGQQRTPHPEKGRRGGRQQPERDRWAQDNLAKRSQAIVVEIRDSSATGTVTSPSTVYRAKAY